MTHEIYGEVAAHGRDAACELMFQVIADRAEKAGVIVTVLSQVFARHRAGV